MAKLDLNALIGNWPFRKIRDNTFDKIRARHEQNGFEGGFLSSSDAIFYNDPMEGDLDLAKAIEKYPNYRQIMTVNPMLPGTCANIRRGVRELNVAGVKIYPHFHKFDLHDPRVEEMCELLKEHNLPLFINLHMDDYRSEYMILSQDCSAWDVMGFIQRHRDFPILICNPRVGEVRYFSNFFSCYDNVAFDSGSLKLSPFAMQNLYETGLTKYMVYGSNAPIGSMGASMVYVDVCKMPEEEKARIYSGEAFLKAIDPKYRPVIK